MANSKVPKFGGWNSGDNVGYTAFFESARKGKAGGTSPIRNPNEMFLNSDMESAAASPRSPPQPASRPTTTTSSKPTPPKQQQQQPKFGVWNEDTEEDIPYTAYFENTTKTKTNPNEPQPPRMNRDMAAVTASTPAAAASKPSTKQQQQQPKFGVWNEEEEEDIPYTAYFENTTNTKTNPNEPPARMNRDMVGASAAISKPTTKQQQQQPKFGEWNEEAPYTAYFENNTRKDNIHAPKSSTEPQMNRDMVTPTPAISRPDPRANEQQMGYGVGRGGGGGGGEGRRGGRQQQVQFASGGRSSAEPSHVHHRAGGGRSNGGSSNTPPKKSPLHYAAQQGPSVPPFGDWGKEENYSEVFGQINKDGTPPGRGYNNASPYHHRSNPQNNQTKKQPKCGFLSWLCP